MPPMRILLTRRPDGASVLRCERSDGSVTWQTVHGTHAEFFPYHDLTHFAVETELGIPDAFFGLLAAGWEVDDTGGKTAKGPLPPAAVLVEHIVGLLDSERASGHIMQEGEFQETVRNYVAQHPSWARPADAALEPGALACIRARRGALISQFRALPPGEAFELAFEVSEVAS